MVIELDMFKPNCLTIHFHEVVRVDKEAAALIDSMQVYSVKHEVAVETRLSGDLML